MPRLWLLTIVAVVLVTLIALRPELRSHGSDRIEPQTFTVTTGGTRTVAQGRAQIWLSAVRFDHRTEQGDVTSAAEIEMTCRGETFKEIAVLGMPWKEICGCRVRLVEVLDTRPPSVRMEVTWMADAGSSLQSASQFSPPRRQKRDRL